MKRLLALVLALLMTFALCGCGDVDPEQVDQAIQELEQVLQELETAPEWTEGETYPDISYSDPVPTEHVGTATSATVPDTTVVYSEPALPETEQTEPPIDPDGWYYSAEEVSLYIYTYGCLPDNYITKSEARSLGWDGGSVEYYAHGCAIGGDRFYNYDGQLPGGRGTLYYECDIDTDGYRSRGAKRLVFTYEGDIYYTDDHYETFVCLYGEELP